LKAGKVYHIGVKVSFPYEAPVGAAPPSKLGTNFGCIYVETFNPKNQAYDGIPLIPQGCDANANYPTLNNLPLVDFSATNGFALVHSQSIDDMPTIQPITPSTYGLKSSSRQQRLVFTTYTLADTYAGGLNYPLGIEFYMNPLIKPASTVFVDGTTSIGSFSQH
jgi:hypothetical protein